MPWQPGEPKSWKARAAHLDAPGPSAPHGGAWFQESCRAQVKSCEREARLALPGRMGPRLEIAPARVVSRCC